MSDTVENTPKFDKIISHSLFIEWLREHERWLVERVFNTPKIMDTLNIPRHFWSHGGFRSQD